ncbi:hypothetical protein [Bradyrhizobium sp. sGM-13]|uniref:hypothetical protein n=1 Tax=Bradyrhizobium sp. sGM-13 TaxID=2831781 RepID=UPI001BCB98D4|nr:hypothetical protein [Bradyrhizobium sp. sGM-13]
MFRLVVGFAAASCILIGVAIARSDDVKRVSANGTELSYVEVGQGEPVIFVHGGLQDYRMGCSIFQGSPIAIAPLPTAAATTSQMRQVLRACRMALRMPTARILPRLCGL